MPHESGAEVIVIGVPRTGTEFSLPMKIFSRFKPAEQVWNAEGRRLASWQPPQLLLQELEGGIHLEYILLGSTSGNSSVIIPPYITYF